MKGSWLVLSSLARPMCVIREEVEGLEEKEKANCRRRNYPDLKGRDHDLEGK